MSSFFSNLIPFRGFFSPVDLGNNEYVKLRKHSSPDLGIQQLLEKQKLWEAMHSNQGTAPLIEIIDPKKTEQLVAIGSTPTVPSLTPSGLDEIVNKPLKTDTLIKSPFVTSTLAKLASLWPLIPPFTYALYSSRQKILQNINVTIDATSKQKIYQIGFGKKDNKEVSIAVEVKRGQRIRFLHEKDSAKKISSYVPAIFRPTSLLSYAPGLKHFEYKREETKTECNIIINDPLLKGSPRTHYFPLFDENGNSWEGFHIIHRNPNLHKENDLSSYDVVMAAESSEYDRMSSVSVKVNPDNSHEKQRTQTMLLHFEEIPKVTDDAYLRVTQYR